jgi:hypothetical protein
VARCTKRPTCFRKGKGPSLRVKITVAVLAKGR